MGEEGAREGVGRGWEEGRKGKGREKGREMEKQRCQEIGGVPK